MGKSRRGEKEHDEIQRLKEQNKRLKRQVSKLRSVVNNIDMDHYGFVRDLLDSEVFGEREEQVAAEAKLQKKVEKQWECHTCGKGIMRLVIIHRAGIPYYFRKCDGCDHKTKMKPHTEDVKGV